MTRVDGGVALLGTQPLQRVELNEQVYETVRELLLSDQVKPGQRLSLNQIAEDLSVSRSPVHHALTRLVGDGLISVEPRRGYFVRPLTAAAAVHAYDVRQALELAAAESGIGVVSVERLAGLRQAMEPTLAALDGNRLVDKRGYMLANQEFHRVLVGLADNPLLSSIYAQLAVNLLMERILGPGEPDVGGVAEEHLRIVEAFERADLAAAREAIRDHVDTGKRLAVAAIGRAGGSL
jgi:DNA-binding GntR family transcriptional regulator